MRKLLIGSSILLLLFNSIGAFYGGISFLKHPDGSGLGMSLNYLSHSPFNNYFIPGIILIGANGVFGIIVITCILFNRQKYFLLVFAQGLILGIWLLIQITMIRTVDTLHFIMGTVAILLMMLGWLLSKVKSPNQ